MSAAGAPSSPVHVEVLAPGWAVQLDDAGGVTVTSPPPKLAGGGGGGNGGMNGVAAVGHSRSASRRRTTTSNTTATSVASAGAWAPGVAPFPLQSLQQQEQQYQYSTTYQHHQRSTAVPNNANYGPPPGHSGAFSMASRRYQTAAASVGISAVADAARQLVRPQSNQVWLCCVR